MPSRSVQLVLQYDGARFAGWQRQRNVRTVQGALEDCLSRLCEEHIAVTGAGRTDAGVHALGQSAGVRVRDTWDPMELRRALNSILPDDLWVAAAHEMRDEFHARFSASSRAYRYLVGTDENAESPFRRRRELVWRRPLDRAALDTAALALAGRHCFRGFAVRGTAPAADNHICDVHEVSWRDREGGMVFAIRANRFLHHMVRFLVGTMLDIACGRKSAGTLRRLLEAEDNKEVSAPAPAHALYLERVEYPPDLYLSN
ncbi:MAG: tRNA pseudouridine(38-40) synthase TruA [Gemmatimonadaceae bacterium]